MARQYLRNRSSGEIHNKYLDERCGRDQMADENKEVLTWAEVRGFMRTEPEESFCHWCWPEEEE